MKKILAVLSIFAVIAFFYACQKTSRLESNSDQITLTELKKASEDAGIVHNLLLEKAGSMSLAKNDFNSFESNLYSIAKVGDYVLTPRSSGRKLDTKGISDISSFINGLSKLSLQEKNYVKLIITSLQERADIAAFENNVDKILVQIANDVELSTETKRVLAGTAGVAKYSLRYWTDARTNIANPFHLYFKNSLVSRWPTCSEAVDIIAYVDFYNYYSSGGYSPAQAQTAAYQDASYNSGLSLISGACVN